MGADLLPDRRTPAVGDVQYVPRVPAPVPGDDRDARQGLDEREQSLMLICVDRYIADIRKACQEDQGTPDGKPDTIGRSVQESLRALKETVRGLGWVVPASERDRLAGEVERLRRVIDNAYEAACEFTTEPEQALTCVVECLESAVVVPVDSWCERCDRKQTLRGQVENCGGCGHDRFVFRSPASDENGETT